MEKNLTAEEQKKKEAERLERERREKERQRHRLEDEKRRYFDFYDDIKTNGNESW